MSAQPTLPSTMLVPVIALASALAADQAYGAAVISLRGLSVSKMPEPAGRMRISSHWRSPANWAGPKSSGNARRKGWRGMGDPPWEQATDQFSKPLAMSPSGCGAALAAMWKPPVNV